MEDWQQRTELLVGESGMEALRHTHVLVVGLGGVGAYAAEMLCRAGIGEMTVVDADTVQPTNLNRQLPALHSTLGQAKSEVMAKRLLDINPALRLHAKEEYLCAEEIPLLLDAMQFDFVVDAIDTLAPKCELIAACVSRKIRMISSMGAGGKQDLTKVQYASVWDTYHCKLSKAVRKNLSQRNIRYKLPVVFSTEQADPKAVVSVQERNKKSTCGTISYLPAVFGCYLASYVIQKILKQ